MSRSGPPYQQSGAPKSRELQQQVKFDYSLGTDVKCDKCGNCTFEAVSLLKHYSDIASPIGKATMVPTPTFACNHCGFVNNAFIPPGYFGNKTPSTGDTQSEPESKTEVKKPLIDIVR